MLAKDLSLVKAYTNLEGLSIGQLLVLADTYISLSSKLSTTFKDLTFLILKLIVKGRLLSLLLIITFLYCFNLSLINTFNYST